MDFRRSGQRDERRRRVLLEETGVEIAAEAEPGTGAETRAPRAATEPIRHYTDAITSPRQPRAIDLIPKRRWTNLVIFLLALATAAALEGAYGYLALRHAPAEMRRYPAIDLATGGSAVTWLAAAFLGLSAVMGVLTYQIRRYRVDDYRGRYRMWYWMVPLLVIASVDCVAGLQQTLRAALLQTAGIPEYADAHLIWIASLTVIVGAIGLRLAIEMRACPLAVFCLLMAGCCFAGIGGFQLAWILPGEGVFQTMVRAGLLMGGHTALLMAMCLYARHVYRDACGEIVSKSPRSATKAKRSGKPVRGVSGTASGDGSAVRRRQKDKDKDKDKDKVLREDPPPAPRRDSATAAPVATHTDIDAPRASVTKEKRRVRAEATPERASGGAAPCTPDNDQSTPDNDQGTPDNDQVEDSRQLSKTERRRLRKLQRRDVA